VLFLKLVNLSHIEYARGSQKVSTNAMAKLGRDEDVRVEVLIRICACLGCTVDDILDIVPDNTELQTQ